VLKKAEAPDHHHHHGDRTRPRHHPLWPPIDPEWGPSDADKWAAAGGQRQQEQQQQQQRVGGAAAGKRPSGSSAVRAALNLRRHPAA